MREACECGHVNTELSPHTHTQAHIQPHHSNNNNNDDNGNAKLTCPDLRHLHVLEVEADELCTCEAAADIGDETQVASGARQLCCSLSGVKLGVLERHRAHCSQLTCCGMCRGAINLWQSTHTHSHTLHTHTLHTHTLIHTHTHKYTHTHTHTHTHKHTHTHTHTHRPAWCSVPTSVSFSTTRDGFAWRFGNPQSSRPAAVGGSSSRYLACSQASDMSRGETQAGKGQEPHSLKIHIEE